MPPYRWVCSSLHASSTRCWPRPKTNQSEPCCDLGCRGDAPRQKGTRTLGRSG
ncbi:unnamed protein product [Lepidochelys kempii]